MICSACLEIVLFALERRAFGRLDEHDEVAEIFVGHEALRRLHARKSVTSSAATKTPATIQRRRNSCRQRRARTNPGNA